MGSARVTAKLQLSVQSPKNCSGEDGKLVSWPSPSPARTLAVVGHLSATSAITWPQLKVRDLSGEVDIVTDTEQRFFDRLTSGDDFAQWTLRFGCVLLDDRGVMRRGAELISRRELWPDPADKVRRVKQLAELADKVLRTGDGDAGQEHLRAALTAMARGALLARGVFPLARAELPLQLHTVGEPELAAALERAIRESLVGRELSQYLGQLRDRPELTRTWPEAAR